MNGQARGRGGLLVHGQMIMRDIEAIYLDVGNTLRVLVEDECFQAEARQQLAALIGAQEPIEVLFERLNARWKNYRRWAVDQLADVGEHELWTRFLLPDYPVEEITPLTGELTRLWRNKDGRRITRSDVRATIVELDRRGYCLGIIANTITEREIPDWLKSDRLMEYFATVVLSSKVHRRKPGPDIFWEATRCTGIAPERSAYVGDNPARDLVGARRAGFGTVIILMDRDQVEKGLQAGVEEPDAIIHELRELLDIFPERPDARASKQGYDRVEHF